MIGPGVKFRCSRCFKSAFVTGSGMRFVNGLKVRVCSACKLPKGKPDERHKSAD